MSIYSIAALYSGTINVGVGDSPNVEIGDSPTVTVTDGDNGGSSSDRGSSSYSEPFVEVFNQTLGINKEGEIVKNTSQNENVENLSPLTGGVIGFIKSGKIITPFLILIAIVGLAIVFSVKGKKK